MKPSLVILDADSLPGTDWEAHFPETLLTVHKGTTPDQRLEHIGDAELVLTSKVPFDAELIRRLPRVRYLGIFATGYNNIDTTAAREQRITVTNIPGYSTMSVAQYVFAFINELMLNFSRQIRLFPDGTWEKRARFCYWEGELHEIAGKTIGLVGMGAIGSTVARIAKAFEMRVIAHTPSGIPREPGVEMVGLEQLLRESDIVSLHCPLTSENRGFMNTDAFAKMKPSAILINTARGLLVDETALAHALHQGIIAGAGLDVIAVEPPDGKSPLTGVPNLVVTPHQAWATEEALERLIQILSANLKAFLNGTPQNKVN